MNIQRVFFNFAKIMLMMVLSILTAVAATCPSSINTTTTFSGSKKTVIVASSNSSNTTLTTTVTVNNISTITTTPLTSNKYCLQAINRHYYRLYTTAVSQADAITNCKLLKSSNKSYLAHLDLSKERDDIATVMKSISTTAGWNTANVWIDGAIAASVDNINFNSYPPFSTFNKVTGAIGTTSPSLIMSNYLKAICTQITATCTKADVDLDVLTLDKTAPPHYITAVYSVNKKLPYVCEIE